MTLSLDDVRNKRFRMARKSGYEVLEVDEFVDEVEATFGQLFQENQNLKKQVESLKSTSSVPEAEAPAASSPGSADKAPAPVVPAERIVVTTSKEASSAVVRLVELTTEQSEQLVAEAVAEAARIREEAAAAAQQAEAEAQGRSEELDRDLAARRTELFGELESQREQLSSTVNALRAFEATYRANLTQHLQSQIEVLASGSEEPADPPAALTQSVLPAGATAAAGAGPSSGDRSAADGGASGDGNSSDTPRLDALLGDQR